MIIIVEGSNKVGKSALISKLSKMYNTTAIYNRDILNKMSNVKQESYISALAMLDVLKSTSKNQNIILDRFHLSEFVYGNYYRGYLNYKMFEIEDELNAMNTLLILLASDYNHIEDKNMVCQYMAIQKMFYEAYKRSKIRNKIILKLEDI